MATKKQLIAMIAAAITEQADQLAADAYDDVKEVWREERRDNPDLDLADWVGDYVADYLALGWPQPHRR